MKLKTVRMRRSRPSALAFALALMLTMLCVYIVSLPSQAAVQQVSAPNPVRGEVHLSALDALFQLEGRYAGYMDAHLAAARCAQAGGAGLVLLDGDQYAVVFQAGGEDSENTLKRGAAGLTLQLSGPSGDVQAISDAAAFLQALHGETGALATSLEQGNTNASSIASLMEIYRTRGERAQRDLIAIQDGSPVVSALLSQVEDALSRLECTAAQPTTAHLRHLHAAACADWLSLLETLAAMAQQQAPI